jgi:hypothetical protein
VEITSDGCIRIYQGASTIIRKAFDVGGGNRAPELYAVCPDGFENCFIEGKFVIGRKF